MILPRLPTGIFIMGLLSFLFGCAEKEAPFQEKGGLWHYRELRIEDADAKTFQVINENYARDKGRVYYGDTYRKGQEYYMIKHSRLRVLDGADPATFRYLNYDYARDKAAVFYEGVAFPVKDVQTFELIDRAFARDRVTGYYQQRPIPGSDGTSFTRVDDRYSKDARHVFHSATEPRGTDPIRRSTLVKGALPGSFKILDIHGHAADAAQAYYRGELVTKDVASFKVLDLGYAKTATRVYYDGKPIPQADAASFAMLEPETDPADAKDRSSTYKRGKKVQPQ